MSAAANKIPNINDPTRDVIVDSGTAAALLGLTPKGLQMWRDRRFGPPYLKYARTVVRYRLRDIEEFKAAHTVPPRLV